MPFGFGVGDDGDARQPGGFDMANLGAALQQLGAMLQSGQAGPDAGGPVNWAMVTDVARKALVAQGDPSVSDAERRAVTDAVRLADVWLDGAVTFPAVTAAPAAWSRSEWLEETLPTWRRIVQPIAEHMQQVVGQSLPGSGELDIATLQENLPEQLRDMLPDGLPPEFAQMMAPMLGMMQQLGAVAFSMQLGQALAGLAGDVLGASDIGIPLTDEPRAALLPANVARFGEGQDPGLAALYLQYGRYLLLASSNDSWVMIATYALFIGPAAALMGSMAANVLVTRWFSGNQGKAFGLVNLPLGMMVVPIVAAHVLEQYGLQVLYLVSGLALLLIIPAAWVLVDHPQDIGQRAEDSRLQRDAVTPPMSPVSVWSLLRRLELWGIGVALGIIIGAATMKQAHLVPLLREQGHSLQLASTLLALTSGAGAVGSILIGWLADRFGGLSILLANATLQAMMWLVFLFPASVSLLVFDAIVMGACGGGVSAAQGVLISRYFGTANFGRALGIIGLIAAPFMLGLNTVAGVVHDQTGSYREPVVLIIAATAFAAMVLWGVSRRADRT